MTKLQLSKLRVRKLEENEQREQLGKVIDCLMETGDLRKEIAAKIESDNIKLSQICNGTIKHIPEDLIEKLHEKYNVNPDYIYYGSACMFDSTKVKYENFEEFVDKWELVDYNGNPYLHFTMDKNFYKFLIDVYAQKEILEANGKSSRNKAILEQAINIIKRQYNNITPEYKDYVLIPTDVMETIVTGNPQKRKALQEVIDIINLP